MVTNIRLALRYWFEATIRPGKVIEAFQANPQKVAISFWINFIFAALYSITALLLYLGSVPLAIPPWMPVEAEVYYLYQPLWTIPWGLATWIMISGISHLIAIAGRQDQQGALQFEDALAVVAIGWVAPSFYFMWLPETFLVPFLGNEFMPAWLNLLRVSFFPVIWQTYLVAMGMRKTHQTTWIRALVIGVTSEVVFFMMFLAFMR